MRASLVSFERVERRMERIVFFHAVSKGAKSGVCVPYAMRADRICGNNGERRRSGRLSVKKTVVA
jgi:hypothetical protein